MGSFDSRQILRSADSYDEFFGVSMAVPEQYVFSVNSFFLEKDEASVECYDTCVAAFACPPRTYEPGRDELPASVSIEGAAAFCRYRGGRLPTLAELSRASHLAAREVGAPTLVDAYLACIGDGLFRDGFSATRCGWLKARAPAEPIPALPVGSEPRDVGPFGHRDLFGAQLEVTSTRAFMDGDPELMFPPGVPPDPGSFGTGLIAPFSPVFQLRDAAVKGALYLTIQYLMSPEVIAAWGPLFGVRCAFDGEFNDE